MTKVFAAVVFCVLTFLSAQPTEAAVRQENGVYIVDDAEGYAPIKGGNKNAARDEARREAYRNALERALGAAVTGVTEMENYAVVRDKVFSQTAGIVKEFDIVREWSDDDDVFHLIAKCKVSTSALDGVLGPAVLDAIGNPRVMILMDERIGDKSSFLPVSEAAVQAVFERAGYLMVDPDQARALINVDPASAYNEPDKIMDAARTMRADVVILGKAHGSVFRTGKVEGITMYGVKGTVQLKAVHTRSAYQISSKTVEQSTGKKPALSPDDGASRCFKEAGRMAASDIVHKIAYSLVSGTAGGVPGITVNVKISNITFKQAKSVEERLGELAGKNGAVYAREYKDGMIEFDVVSEKNAQSVASFLADIDLDVEGVTAQTVSASAAGSSSGASSNGEKKPGGFCDAGSGGMALLLLAALAVCLKRKRVCSYSR